MRNMTASHLSWLRGRTTFFFASFNGVNHEVFLFEKGDPIRTVCFAIYICVSIRSRSSWDPAGSAESKFIETGCD
jgi:hypothetical protein